MPAFSCAIENKWRVVLTYGKAWCNMKPYTATGKQMKTTVTFKPELEQKIKEFMQTESRAYFADAVKRLIELGLASLEKKG